MNKLWFNFQSLYKKKKKYIFYIKLRNNKNVLNVCNLIIYLLRFSRGMIFLHLPRSIWRRRNAKDAVAVWNCLGAAAPGQTVPFRPRDRHLLIANTCTTSPLRRPSLFGQELRTRAHVFPTETLSPAAHADVFPIFVRLARVVVGSGGPSPNFGPGYSFKMASVLLTMRLAIFF